MENTTAPTSLPAELSSESLNILNVVDGRVQKLLKSRVCDLEQQARDADDSQMHAFATVLKDEARVTECLRFSVSSVITETFLEVLRSLSTSPTITTTHSPELPSLPRRPYGSGAVVAVSAICSGVQPE